MQNISTDSKEVQEAFTTHQSAWDQWPYGLPQTAWLDDSGNLCIKYESDDWFHYRQENGSLEWW